jgi:ATP-binding cassette, subfamily B, bacterial
MRHLPRVLAYLRPYPLLALATALLTVVDALASLLAPWPLKFLFDSVLGSEPLPPLLAAALGPLNGDRVGMLIVFSAAGLAAALLHNGLSVLNSYARTALEQRMALDFRGDMFQHAQRLSLAYHDQQRGGGMIYAINYQASAAAGLVMAIPPLAQSLVTLVGMLWISFQIEPQLAVMSLAVMPILIYSVRYYMTHIEGRLRDVKGMEAESLSIIHEAMSMLRVIVAFGREDHEYRRFRGQGEQAVDARVNLTVRQTVFSMVVNLTTAAGTALVLGFGVYQALKGNLTGGQLLVVMSYMSAVYRPLESISYTVGSLQDNFVSLQIGFDLLDTEPDIKDAPGAADVERASGRVTFEGVDFSYTGRSDTLTDISFDARPGQVIAIVGQTGAGKTTLISLIPRFYEPKRGRVLLDGVDVGDLTLRSLRRQISIVLQEPLLFSGTIAENIRYGRLDASMDDVVAAARAANAHDFIARLPNGYESVLGERGTRLSGGERQRIAVARAFLKDAPILILDEPTSSVDSKTEVVILDALDRLMVGRTTFMIAHRLSTVRHADLILVLSHGRLVEQGTHDDLLARDGLYRQLHDVQVRGRSGSQRAVAAAAAATGQESP